MKILILTTLDSEEIERLTQEAKLLGHDCISVNLSKLAFSIIDSSLTIENYPDFIPDVVILKGITMNKAAIVALVNDFRRKGIKVFDNNYVNHLYTINKVADLMKLSMAKIPLVDTYHTYDYANYPGICEKLGYPVIIKVIGAGKGAGVFMADNEDEMRSIVSIAENEMNKPAKRFVIQRFIPYVHDLRVLIIGDQTFVMKRIPSEKEFRANFSLGGDVEIYNLDTSGINLARKALESLDMSIGGVDLLITSDDKRYVLEVNHTPGFIGMEKATNKNIAKIYLEHALKTAK